MLRVTAALLLAALAARESAGFSPAGAPLLRASPLSPLASRRPLLSSPLPLGKRSVPPSAAAPLVSLRASSAVEEEVNEPFIEIPEDFDIYSKSLDDWFTQLGADNNDDRTLAGYAISQQHTDNGQEEEVIDRLFGMLTLKEVLHRRAAVQSLGMIGEKILPRTQNLMLTTDCMTTRASCSKVMGAVALRHPESLNDYPQDALDSMRKAMTEIPDPVTKVASMSALAQIAGGDMANGHVGCKRALDLIVDLGRQSEDVSLLMSVTNALAAIARNNPQWNEMIFDEMEGMQKAKAEVEGFGMVSSMLRTHLMTLSRGTRGRDFPTEKEGGEGFSSMGFSAGWGKDDDEDSEDDEDWDDVAASMARKK